MGSSRDGRFQQTLRCNSISLGAVIVALSRNILLRLLPVHPLVRRYTSRFSFKNINTYTFWALLSFSSCLPFTRNFLRAKRAKLIGVAGINCAGARACSGSYFAGRTLRPFGVVKRPYDALEGARRGGRR